MRINGDFALSLARARIARAGAPKRFTGYVEAERIDTLLSHDEDLLLQAAAFLKLKKQDQVASVQGRGWIVITAEEQANYGRLRGDIPALSMACASYCSYAQNLVTNANVAAMLHDPRTSRGRIAEALVAGGNSLRVLADARNQMDMAENDWQAAVRDANAYLAAAATEATMNPGYRGVWKTNIGEPRLAEAQAHTGNMAGALALIASTPLDCDDCVRTRGRIAALNRDWAAAARWFQMVSARSPDIPFADADWGPMLLAAGDAAGAVSKFQSANKKGPKFADPLEGWGEALMAQNRSDLALAKFAEANKYAPNWGRLHLKWGEALTYAGKKDEAAKQFARATQLDLTAADKAELGRQSPHA